jgi:hypothetical protein
VGKSNIHDLNEIISGFPDKTIYGIIILPKISRISYGGVTTISNGIVLWVELVDSLPLEPTRRIAI